ncbi:MAG TPA: ZIP zinc transporter, partial [Lachnospiraceae bacterium]|nr:ZIP zinc transporter [Lachnospiraceae bacterium]
MTIVAWGLLIPFIGTSAGAACVFFLKKDLKADVQRALTGFAAGVMVAASIWSLIVPAIEQSEDKGRWAFLPAFIGFWLGILFLLLLDHVIPHLHRSIDQEDQVEGPKA